LRSKAPPKACHIKPLDSRLRGNDGALCIDHLEAALSAFRDVAAGLAR
jgi:hypothetical protein